MTQPGREGPLTIASLVDEVLDSVRGYARNQDIVSSLAVPMTDADLACTVSDPAAMSKGTLEIEDELLYAKAVDQSTGVVQLEPWGRGLSGTLAVQHAAGVKVTANPLYSRQRVRNSIYGVLREIFPDIYAVRTVLLDGNPAKPSYVMDPDCWKVISVHVRSIYDQNLWMPVRRWRTSSTELQTELQLLSGVIPGSGTIRVTYVRTPAVEMDQTTDLSGWGYDMSIRDVIVMGGVLRLLQYGEANRLQTQTMEATGRSEVTPAGASTSVVRLMYSMFQKRVDDEKRQLERRFPAQPHLTR